MVTAPLLPCLAPCLAYPAQILIPLLEGTLPADDRVSTGRDQRYGSVLLDGSIALLEAEWLERQSAR
jgi:hypothetical protein